MVGGLSSLVTQEGNSVYRTSSSTVTRVVAYLEVVGYAKGVIQYYDV